MAKIRGLTASGSEPIDSFRVGAKATTQPPLFRASSSGPANCRFPVAAPQPLWGFASCAKPSTSWQKARFKLVIQLTKRFPKLGVPYGGPYSEEILLFGDLNLTKMTAQQGTPFLENYPCNKDCAVTSRVRWIEEPALPTPTMRLKADTTLLLALSLGNSGIGRPLCVQGASCLSFGLAWGARMEKNSP